jgi:endonuclease YncB( thermonuclease family)
MRRLLLALCLAGAGAAQAMSGVVTHVTDGDTVWVRPAEGKPLKVRLVGIDAPERCQAWGAQSKAALAAKLLNQPVELTVQARDDYQRLLATVQLRGENVNAWLVSQGHAWSAHFRNSLGPYAAEEKQARAARRGLFADEQALNPRDFRKAHGTCNLP